MTEYRTKVLTCTACGVQFPTDPPYRQHCAKCHGVITNCEPIIARTLIPEFPQYAFTINTHREGIECWRSTGDTEPIFIPEEWVVDHRYAEIGKLLGVLK